MNEAASDNRALIESILGGDQSAFRAFVDQYQRLVAHIVYRMVPNTADREDLCQDIFFRIYQNFGGFQFGSKVSTWVARIAYNASVNYLQKKRIPLIDDLRAESDGRDRIGEMPDPAAALDETVANRDLFGRLQAEMAHLSPQFRALLTLYHLDEMTYEEIAEVTGLPMGTVKSYLFRARQMLRDRLLKKYRLEDIWQQGT